MFTALALAGCGQDELCAEVDCDFGECDSQSGQCVNVEECRLSDDCLPGYECSEEGVCEALTDCSADDECETGTCEDGVCVNPPSCETNDDCLDRTFCEDGECVWDPCNDTDCMRGVCQPGTDQCVSADSCTPETEELDCVAGDKCADGTCADADEFCDFVECDRGVCSYEDGGCGNADNCEGSDELCLDGYFCNDQNTCQPNLCEQSDIDCEDDGVCQPGSGECQSASPCESHAQCENTPKHFCFNNECKLESELCGNAEGDGGCPANQICDVDFDENTAECLEPEQCETSFDCVGERQCGGRECIEPIACNADLLEPNNATGEATDFFEHAEENTLRASLCQGDTDVFSFNSEEIIDPGARGRLMVEVDVPRRDHGLGKLEVALTDGNDNTEVASTGSMGRDGSVIFERGISLTDHGDYTVEISAGDDFNEAGVEYDLSVNLIPHATVDACADALPLATNSRISGDTSESPSFFLGSNCIEQGPDAAELVYELELDGPQELTFELQPQLSGADLSMSLRSECTQPASERNCVDGGVEGETETMTQLLGEGTHYLIVQGGDSAGGGPFELTVQTVFTGCSAQSNYCEDSDIAQICTADGGRFQSIECEAGCNPSSGDCYPPEGDKCLDAPVIEPSEAYTSNDEDDGDSGDNGDNGDDGDNGDEEQLPETEVYERTLDLAQHADEYQLDPSSSADDFCMELSEDGTTKSGGPDGSFQVEVPAMAAVKAEVSFANEVEGSLYFVENCDMASDTCAAGAVESTDNDFREEVTYSNFTQNDETLYLVVDTAEGQEVSIADVTFTYDPIICLPQEGEDSRRRCHPNDDQSAQECHASGTFYQEYDDCTGWGCASGACLYPDTCDQALDITARANQPGGATMLIDDWTHFTNEMDGSTCGLSSLETDGDDFFVKLDMQADQILQASLNQDSGSYDPSLIITGDCENPDNACYDSHEVYSGAAEVLYHAQSDETVYIIGNHDDAGTASEFTFEVGNASVECDPGVDAPTCADSSNLEYCESFGTSTPTAGTWTQFACSGGCSGGACGNPSGELCADAIDVTSDALQEGGTTKTVDLSNFQNDYDYDETACSDVAGGVDSPGNDVVYSVDAEQGDIIEVEWDTPDDPALYITTNCQDLNGSCVAGDEDYGNSTVSTTFVAQQDGVHYIVGDVDEDSSVTYGSSDMSIDVRKPECVQGSDPVSCIGSDTLEYCDAHGSWANYTCDGGCSNGECGNPTADTWFDTVNITSQASQSGGVSIDGSQYSGSTWGNYTNAFEGTGCGLTETYTQGFDAVFIVDLSANETVEAKLGINASGIWYNDPAVYILDSPDTTVSDSACLDGERANDAQVTAKHTASSDETVYVVADGDDNSSSSAQGEDWELDVEIY